MGLSSQPGLNHENPKLGLVQVSAKGCNSADFPGEGTVVTHARSCWQQQDRKYLIWQQGQGSPVNTLFSQTSRIFLLDQCLVAGACGLLIRDEVT